MGTGRARRRLGYVPLTLRARVGARPGPPPVDDAGWAALLRHWVDLQAARLAADAVADADGRPVPAPQIDGRGRRLWNLAHLARHGIGGREVTEAIPAARTMVDRHLDDEHGGYRWRLGDAPADPWKLLSGQCIAIQALSELTLADPRTAPRALTDARIALELAAARITPCGALHEFLDRRWSPLPDRTETEMGRGGTVTLGGQLHLVEAAAALVEASGDVQATEIGRTTAALIHDRFLSGVGHPDRHWIDLHGNPLPEPVSLGHKVEAAWILADAAPRLGLEGERERARAWVDEVLDAGFHHGGLDPTPEPGFRLGGHQRSWWMQTELLRALVEVDDGPDSPTRPPMHELLRWLHGHQVDPRSGQARQLMTHWGVVLQLGDRNTTRTGYHDVRAYLAAADLLDPPPSGPG